MATDYKALLDAAQTEFGLPDGLVHAVQRAESGGTRNPATARSSAGAVGPMQLMEATASDMGVDRFKDDENIRGGAKFLRENLDRFGGDTVAALVAYNWGPTHARRWKSAGADPAKLPEETRKYVKKITTGLPAPAPAPVEAPAPAPVKTGVRRVNYQGITVPMTVPSAWTDTQAEEALVKQGLAPDIIAKHAVQQGKRFNVQTGAVEDYGAVDKFLIGMGSEFANAGRGANQLYQQAVGNGEGLKQLRDQTDQERELYQHLDNTGLGAEDVGQILAYAPTVWGPTGILRLAGGVLGRTAVASAEAGTLAAMGAEGNTDDPRWLKAAEAAGTVGALTIAPLGAARAAGGLASLLTKIPPVALAKTALAAVVDFSFTGGAASAYNAYRALEKSGGGEPARIASEWFQKIGKLSKDKTNIELSELAKLSPDAEVQQAAAAALERRIAGSFAEDAAKAAAEVREASARLPSATKRAPAKAATGPVPQLPDALETARAALPKAGPKPYAGAKPSTAPLPELPAVTAPKPQYRTGAKVHREPGSTQLDMLDEFAGIPKADPPGWVRR